MGGMVCAGEDASTAPAAVSVSGVAVRWQATYARGGYKTKRQRKSWTEAENTYLRDHWGRTPAEEIAAALGRTLGTVQLQKKRLGISTRYFDDWTIRDLEDREYGLGIDHRLLHCFISRGWLRAWEQPRSGAVPVTRA
jgi:hypothetical protein